MDIVAVLSNPGAVLAAVGHFLAAYGPIAVAIDAYALTVLPEPGNQRTAYAVAHRWMEYASGGFLNGKTAIAAKLDGDLVPAPAPAPVVPLVPPKA